MMAEVNRTVYHNDARASLFDQAGDARLERSLLRGTESRAMSDALEWIGIVDPQSWSPPTDADLEALNEDNRLHMLRHGDGRAVAHGEREPIFPFRSAECRWQTDARLDCSAQGSRCLKSRGTCERSWRRL